MKVKNFIEWIKGFTQGVHHYNITPKQWDELKEKLDTVDSVKSHNWVSTPGWTQTTTWE